MKPDDEDWDSFAAPQQDTDADVERPTPEELAAEEAAAAPRAADPVHDQTTGKYKSVEGLGLTRETVEQIANAKGRTTERTFMLASFRFFLIGLGSNMAGADDLVQRLHAWVQVPENKHLVEVALGWDKNPP